MKQQSKIIVLFVVGICMILFSSMFVMATSYSGGVGDYKNIDYPDEVTSGKTFQINWILQNIGYPDYLWTKIYKGDVLLKESDCESLMQFGTVQCFAIDSIFQNTTYQIKVGGFIETGDCTNRMKRVDGTFTFTVFIHDTSPPPQTVVCHRCNGNQVESVVFNGTQCPIGWQSTIPQCQDISGTQGAQKTPGFELSLMFLVFIISFLIFKKRR